MPTAEPSPVAPADYRRLIGRFATGVSVVTTLDDGHRYGMTVNSLTSVSLDPVLVLFCCVFDATLHDPLLRSGVWGVSILAAGQEGTAKWFATHGTPRDAQFANQAAFAGRTTGVPLLPGALGWLECRTWATYDGGDHTIVVGEVLAVEPGEDTDPLLYFRGDYTTLT